MPPSATIKRYAKASLKEKWPEAIGVGAILLAVYAVHIVFMQIAAMVSGNYFGETVSFIISVALVVAIIPFFAMPLLYGALRWFWFTSLGYNVPVSEVFCYFSGGPEYLKALSLSFRVFLRIASILFICFLPSIIVTVLSQPTTYELLNYNMPYWVSSIWVLGNALNLFGVIMSFILLVRYVAAPILMINDNNLSPQEALNLSVIISKNANGKTIGFLFSFFGWYLLSLMIIPMLYTLPLFLCSYAVYCKHLIDYYNSTIALNSGNYFTAPSI